MSEKKVKLNQYEAMFLFGANFASELADAQKLAVA